MRKVRPSANGVRRIARRLVRAAKGTAISRGLLPYHALEPVDPAAWDREYGKGVLDDYAALHEAARYGVLLGWLRVLGPGLSILDYGCGTGVLRERLPEDSFSRYLGVDISATAIEHAQRLADARTEFRAISSLERDIGVFDLVICNEVLYYVPEPGTLLDRLRDVIAPGGHLLTSNWRHPGDTALHAMIDERFERLDAVDVTSIQRRGRRWRLALHRAPHES